MKTIAIWIGAAGLLLGVGCGGQRTLDEVQSMEYQNARPGKALVYPEGIDRPQQSSAYAIPRLSPKVAGQDYDVNELARPPALFDHSVLEDGDEADGAEDEAE